MFNSPHRKARRVVAAVLLATVALVPAAVVLARRLRRAPDPFPRARLLLASGDVAAAEERVRATLALRPRDAAAWQLLGECRRLRGDADAAEQAWRRARTLAPTWDTPVVALASRALAAGREGEARRLITETLRRGGNTAAVLRLDARLRARAADFAGAAAALRRAAAAPGGKARDLLEAARHERAAAFVRGTPAPGVEALLAAALRRARGEEDSADVVRAVEFAMGVVEPTAAADGARTAESERDDATADAAAVPDEYTVRRTLALDRRGALREALASADALRRGATPLSLAHAAAVLAPQDRVRLAALLACPPDATVDDVLAAEARAHLAAARRQARAVHEERGDDTGSNTGSDMGGRERLAEAHLRALATIRPDDPDASFALGMRLGSARRAETTLAVAGSLPGGVGGDAARRLLGWYHVGADDAARAAAYLLPRTSRTSRTSDEAAREAVSTARTTTDPAATAAAARAAAARHPGDAAPRLLLGLLAERRGDAPAACVHLAAALARDPSLAVAANDLAWLLAIRGDAAGRARPLAAWAAHLLPSDPRIRHTASTVRRLANGATTFGPPGRAPDHGAGYAAGRSTDQSTSLERTPR